MKSYQISYCWKESRPNKCRGSLEIFFVLNVQAEPYLNFLPYPANVCSYMLMNFLSTVFGGHASTVSKYLELTVDKKGLLLKYYIEKPCACFMQLN